MNRLFWKKTTEWVQRHSIRIDRPKGSPHPDWPGWNYPLDYGYLEHTQAVEGAGIDVWLGSQAARRLTGFLCTLEVIKNELEVKLLLGCTSKEVELIRAFHNRTMPTLYIPNTGRYT